MIKYSATASVLKAFSINKSTRRLYRAIGNKFGGRSRAQSVMPGYYMERVQRMLDLAANRPLLRHGSRMLELGTGWMHWEALTTRLFFNIEADLYDVWDNRQFAALKSYLSQFLNRLEELKGVTTGQRADVAALCENIFESANFEDLYKLLGFRYLLDPRGMLESVAENFYDLVVSAGVFEHLPRATVEEYIRRTYRVLKPGGVAVHSINTADHLHLYDTTTCPKNYLRYSDKVWKLFFENELQYINRLQRCEWMTIFEEAGFICIEERGSRCDLGDIVVNEQFQAMDQVSLETTSWHAVYRKPTEA
jgi:SAM-dependent methyltransferase